LRFFCEGWQMPQCDPWIFGRRNFLISPYRLIGSPVGSRTLSRR